MLWYVDDLLAWLDRRSAPLWASTLVILFLLLGIPMSWHEASLSAHVTWIGWSICVKAWTVSVPENSRREQGHSHHYPDSELAGGLPSCSKTFNLFWVGCCG